MALSPASQRLIDKARAKASELDRPRATAEEMRIAGILDAIAARLEEIETRLTREVDRPSIDCWI